MQFEKRQHFGGKKQLDTQYNDSAKADVFKINDVSRISISVWLQRKNAQETQLSVFVILTHPTGEKHE